MSELVVAIYPDEQRAAAVLVSLRNEQVISSLNLTDAVSVTRSNDGKVKLHRRAHHPGTVGDAFWHMLIGFLLLTPSVAMGADVSTGAPSGTFSDYGIDDKFVQDLATQMTPGCSALFVLVWNATPDAVIPEVSKFGGAVLRTGLGKEADLRLRDALS